MPTPLSRVRAFLEPRFSTEGLVFVGAGAWSSAYAFGPESERRVVRFGRQPEDFAKDRRAGEALSAVLPVPRVHEIGDAGGLGAYAISDFAPGGHLDALPEPELRRTLPSLLDRMDTLRESAPVAAAGYGAWPSEGDAEASSWAEALLALVREPEDPRMAGWRRYLERDAVAAAGFDAAARALEARAQACPAGVRHTIHADLTAGNVLVDRGRITAIIDWGNSLIGDFLYDVAGLVFWSPWHPGLDPDFILRETRTRCERSGHDVSDFDDRVLACHLHIALENIAYNASRPHAGNLHATLRRLESLRV
ncbi:MAG: aminoglycoside phosphotransferase family protein [Myxococcota bacterium]|nr:aminoglycoside phosphotransferase family protein [Myxococcota bacterium]